MRIQLLRSHRFTTTRAAEGEAQSLGCRSRVVGWLWSIPPYYVHVLVLVHVHVHVPMCTRRQEWQADGATKRQKEALSELLHNLQAQLISLLI